jgi:hypothetical protein
MKKLLLAVSLMMMGLGSAHAETASYDMPVSDPQLAPYAHFTTTYERSVDSQGQVTVTYLLPRELTGDPLTLNFSKTATAGEWTSQYGQMTCSCDTNVSCKVSYDGLPIKQASVMSYLQSLHLSPSDLKARTQVAMAFLEGEPGGILTYDLASGWQYDGTCQRAQSQATAN